MGAIKEVMIEKIEYIAKHTGESEQNLEREWGEQMNKMLFEDFIKKQTKKRKK